MDVSNALVVVSALSSRAVNPDVARACLMLYERAGKGDLLRLDRHSLAVILEDERLGASDDDVWECLVASGLFLLSGSVLVPSSGIAVGSLFEECAERDQVAVSLADIAEVITPRREAPTSSVSALDVCAALRRSQAWASDRARYVASHGLPGFPVFWECSDSEHVPFGSDYGSMTISETLLLTVEQWRYGVACDAEPELALVQPELVHAWEVLLGLEASGDWNDGAMFLPYFDDDFVGAFVSARSEEGSCPTTDATAQRLLTLTQLGVAAGSGPPLADVLSQTRKAMDRAVLALARWQSPVGAWGIYRYPGSDIRQPPVRDVSTRYAAEALVAACASGLLGASAQARATDALAGLADFLESTAQVDETEASWAGDFDDQISSQQDRLRSTVLAAIYLGGLNDVLGDPRLPSLQRGAVNFALARWLPDRDALLHVDFRVPSLHGLATDNFSWDMPTDALVLTAVVELAARYATLTTQASTLVAQASTAVLAGEVHGHWLDLLMAARGKRRAFAQNSLHSVRALRAFVAMQVATATGTLTQGLLGHEWTERRHA